MLQNFKIKLLFFLFLLTIFSFHKTYAQDSNYIVIFHINDMHGHFVSYEGLKKNIISGGYPKISSIINEEREKAKKYGYDVLFFCAGDINTGFPESDMLNGIPDFVMLHYMGLDAAVPGNHEFDNPSEIFNLQQSAGNFPFVCSNFIGKDSNTVFSPFIIKKLKNNLKIGITGFTTEQTNFLSPQFLEGRRFIDSQSAYNNIKNSLKKQSDIVIALSHLGIVPDEREYIPATTSEQLAEKTVGIDIIIDGHSHSLFKELKKIKNTYIAQAGDKAKYLGRFDVYVTDKKISDIKWEAIPILWDDLIADSKTEGTNNLAEQQNVHLISKLAEFFLSAANEKLNKEIGKTEIFLDGSRETARAGESEFTRIIADAIRNKYNTDIAIITGGGIRDSIGIGSITYRDILKVFPFRNTIVIVELTGSEIISMLEFAVKIGPLNGGWLHTSGLTCDFRGKNVRNILINGEKLVSDKIYTLSTTDYIVSGGDGYSMFSNKKLVQTGFLLTDVISDFFKKNILLKSYDSNKRIIRD